MKKSITTLILAVVDSLLLIVIVVSYLLSMISGLKEKESVSSSHNTKRKTSVTTNDTSDSVYEDTSPIVTSEQNAAFYNTFETPDINDFSWVTSEILNGVFPLEAEDVDLENSLGGWKCCILDHESDTEWFGNMELIGTADNLCLRLDWYCVRTGGEEGEVSADESPDSIFFGSVNEDGAIEVIGPGRILITDCYRIGNHQYASGFYFWEDGVSSNIFFVRP